MEARRHGVPEVAVEGGPARPAVCHRGAHGPRRARHKLHELVKIREAEELPSLVSIVRDFVRWREMEQAGGW